MADKGPPARRPAPRDAGAADSYTFQPDGAAPDVRDRRFSHSVGLDPPHRLVAAVAGGVLSYFRAVAVDYDGTLAHGRVAPDTLAAVDEARARGIRVILVTGRILSELRAVFPDVDDHVDAVVAENGDVLTTAFGVRQLAAPIDPAVTAALVSRAVEHRRGQVLVACAGADEPAALDVIRRLGLDYQLVRNRNELMILPAGVTKGTGLVQALADLRLSPHNTIGVGDAENDHTLLDACEVGVAVANAVDALRAHADVTLDRPAGQGVAALLRGPLLTGRAQLRPRRWTITLGDDRGQPVTIPASQLNLAIFGGTGDGKSYLAGLICEQLVRLGYSVVVFDPEGDHVGLGELHNVLVTGGQDHRLADAAEVVQLLRHRDSVSSSTCPTSKLLSERATSRRGRARSKPNEPSAVSRSGSSSTKPTALRPDQARPRDQQPHHDHTRGHRDGPRRPRHRPAVTDPPHRANRTPPESAELHSSAPRR